MAAASPAGPAAWSVAVRLRHRDWLEIRASAENVLPGWGRGGERLSLLLRLRRRLVVAVTSQCVPRPSPGTGTPPPGCKILCFLRSRWARVPPIWRWRRKNKQTVRAASAAPGARSQQNRSSSRPAILRNRAWMPTAATTLWFVAAALAVVLVSIAVFYLKGGRRGGRGREPIAHCVSWWCFLAQFLEPLPSLRNYKWLLRLLKWLLHN